MIISALSLADFRNYKKRQFHFSPTTTLIVGPNAAGKTNILEALHILSIGKSFRADSDQEIIAFGKEMARVKGEINQAINQKTELEIVVTRGSVNGISTPLKRYQVNGVGKRSVDFAGNLRAVLFWPQHLDLVTGSPSLRRRYLDAVLIQTDREYRRALTTYEKAIRQRNRLLEAIRERQAGRHQLNYWNNLVIENGNYLTRKREEYIHFLNKFEIRSSKFEVPMYEILYDKSEISEARLEQYKEAEVAAAVTLVGPHRDDMQIEVRSKPSTRAQAEGKLEVRRDIKSYGSRGEQRLAVFWLALCEVAFITEKTGDKPILLLDDIFSELDESHRHMILSVLGNQQTVMTTTDVSFIDVEVRKQSLIHTL